MDTGDLARFRAVQDAARHTLDSITLFIQPGVTEADLVAECDRLQRAAGVDSYWYKSLPALALVGDNTTLAISQSPYTPGNIPIRETDLVTIDLNPAMAGYYGDYARSYYVEKGVARRTPTSEPEFLVGAKAQAQLHGLLLQVAREDMTFDVLYQCIQAEVDRLGFEKLDYLGHGMQLDVSQLVFLAPGVQCTLGEIGLFTLEPQIRLREGGRFAFKHENIYYFRDNVLAEL